MFKNRSRFLADLSDSRDRKADPDEAVSRSGSPSIIGYNRECETKPETIRNQIPYDQTKCKGYYMSGKYRGLRDAQEAHQ